MNTDVEEVESGGEARPVVGPVIAAERLVRWVVFGGILMGLGLALRNFWYLYAYGLPQGVVPEDMRFLSFSRYGASDWIVSGVVTCFVPLFVLLGCGAMLIQRSQWTRRLLIWTAVIWIGIGAWSFALDLEAAFAFGMTMTDMLAEGCFWYMAVAFYPSVVLVVFTRAEVKAVFGGRGGGGFEPVMGMGSDTSS